MIRNFIVPAVAAVLFPIVACGGTVVPTDTPAPTPTPTTTVKPPPTPTATATATATAPPPPAAKPISFPQAVNVGGTVVAKPKVQPILFRGDPLADSITDFHTKLATSKFWPSVAAEYDIGNIEALPPIVLDEDASTSLTAQQVEAWLTAKLAAGDLGVPDSNTLYDIYYKSGVTITDQGQQSCRAFGGYHGEVVSGTTAVGYAVMPRCQGHGGQTSLDELTIAGSHEIFEWATDPFPNSNPAFADLDIAARSFAFAFQPELGDLCTGLDYGRGYTPADLGYAVQRMWSNKSAAAGHDPCAPSDAFGGAYFVGVPMVADRVIFQRNAATGIQIKVGTPKDVAIQFYTDDKTDTTPWDIEIRDSGDLAGQSYSNGSISYSLAKSSGKNGDVTTVNVTSTAADSALIYIVASRQGEYHVWPAVIVAK